MATGLYYTGRSAWVVLNGTRQPMRRWRKKDAIKDVNVTNFESENGFEEFRVAFKRCDITLEGLANPTLMAVGVGDSIPVILGIGDSYRFSMESCLVLEVSTGTDKDDAATIEYTIRPGGSFALLPN